jgi:hypothetical protein
LKPKKTRNRTGKIVAKSGDIEDIQTKTSRKSKSEKSKKNANELKTENDEDIKAGSSSKAKYNLRKYTRSEVVSPRKEASISSSESSENKLKKSNSQEIIAVDKEEDSNSDYFETHPKRVRSKLFSLCICLVIWIERCHKEIFKSMV